MKNKILLLSMTVLAFAGAGCSKSMTAKDANSSPSAPVVDIDDLLDGDDTGSSSDSNTVTLNTDYVTMNAYVGMRPLNNPSDYKVTVDLTKDSRNRYSGAITISYKDNGTTYQGVFQSGSAPNPDLKYGDGQNMYEHDYNYWWQKSGLNVFSGYFQDQWGGLVLVIDKVSVQGNNDGAGKTVLSGSVWFRNFPVVQAPQGALRRCWFITLGPYDCRSNSVSKKTAIYPADTYRKLGTFSGLSKAAAFKSN